MVAIIIKTYLRKAALKNCISSIEKYLAVPYKLYIYDDSPFKDSDDLKFYEKLQLAGHFIYQTNIHTSPSEARLFLISKLEEEKYVLRIDDDFEFFAKTNLNKMIVLLDTLADAGAVCGLELQYGDGKGIAHNSISEAQGYWHIEEKTLVFNYFDYRFTSYQKINDVRYKPCDFGRNFLLIKREMLDQIRWTKEIGFAKEHEDFFLQIKMHTKWNLYFTPDTTHIHREDINKLADEVYRSSKLQNKQLNADSIKHFQNKWCIYKEKKNKHFRQRLKELRLLIKKNIS